MRGQSQTLSSGAQQKDKRQKSQFAIREIPAGE